MPVSVHIFWTLVLVLTVDASSNIDLSWAVVSSLWRRCPICRWVVKYTLIQMLQFHYLNKGPDSIHHVRHWLQNSLLVSFYHRFWHRGCCIITTPFRCFTTFYTASLTVYLGLTSMGACLRTVWPLWCSLGLCISALHPACSAKKFTLETDMTGKLALHRIVTKQSQDHRNEQHRLILNTFPSPDACFLTCPEEKLCHKWITNMNDTRTRAAQQFHPTFQAKVLCSRWRGNGYWIPFGLPCEAGLRLWTGSYCAHSIS